MTAFVSDSASFDPNSIGKGRHFKDYIATLYFNDAEFDKGSDSFFTAAGTKQYDWLQKDQEINFFAYAPSQDELGADVVVKEDNSGMTLDSFTVADSIGEQVDFITANATGSRSKNQDSGVELTFDHRLAQIEIRAKSENENYVYKVKGARIGRAEYIATFDFNTNQWTLDDWHNTAIYDTSCEETTLTADPVSLMGDGGNAMLIPQKLYAWNPTADPDNTARDAYLSVLVQVTRKDNGYQVYPFPSEIQSTFKPVREFGWASIPLSGTWEQGKKYIYTLDFTNGAGHVDPDDPTPGEEILGNIKFKVNVNDWVDAATTPNIDMNSEAK